MSTNYERSLAACGIILSAGESSRMGEPKALLKSGHRSFFGEAVDAISIPTVKPRLAVIHPCLYGELPGVEALDQVIVNEETERGQVYSLQLALSWMEENDREAVGALVLLVDNPGNLRVRTGKLMEAARRHPETVLAAAFEGESGHPLWLPRRLWAGLCAWTGPEGTRGFLMDCDELPQSVETGRSEVMTDIDTPEEYDDFRRKAKG